MNKKTVLFVLIFAMACTTLLLSACTLANPGQAPDKTELPTPTLNPFFHPATQPPLDSATPTDSGIPLVPALLTGTEEIEAPTAAPETALPTLPATEEPTTNLPLTETPTPETTFSEVPTPEATFTEVPTPTEAYNRIMVFDESVNDNWAVKYGQQMKYNERDKTIAHAGATSLSFTPLADYGTLLFSVRQTSKESYLRSNAVGVSFWLYSDKEIAPSDLIVS